MLSNLKNTMIVLLYTTCMFFATQANARPITSDDFILTVKHVPGTIVGPSSYGSKIDLWYDITKGILVAKLLNDEEHKATINVRIDSKGDAYLHRSITEPAGGRFPFADRAAHMKAEQLLADKFCGSDAFKELEQSLSLPKSVELPEQIPEFIQKWGVVKIEQNFVDKKTTMMLKPGYNTLACRIAIYDFIGNKIYQPLDIPEEAVKWMNDLPDVMTNDEITAFIINAQKLETK